MRKNKKYYFRKIHRYLGVVLGIQFLMWTLGGLYFSWNDIDKVHGDHLRKEKNYLSTSFNLISPQIVIEKLKVINPVDSLLSLQIIEISGRPVYQLRYFSGTNHDHKDHEMNSSIKTQLADAESGTLLDPINESVAVSIAKDNIAEPVMVEKVEYLTTAGSHHEYRGRPLPAWAISFETPESSTVYVSAELGTFETIRHNQWRIFDFLWMLHTMDYQSRDNFGNVLLKAFSIFGLFTVLSGFILYFASSPSINKLKSRM